MGAASAAAQSHLTAAFLQRLHELGWNEGRDVRIEYRWGEGRNERFAEIAAEFVRLQVDLILTHTTPPTLAAKQATSVIPIVFAAAGDPVGTGIVASLARPGGNVTGLSGQAPDTASKRVELLREIIPGLHLLGIFAASDNPLTARDVVEVQEASRTLSLETIALKIQRAQDIPAAFEALKGRAQALYVSPDPLAATNDAYFSRAGRGGRSDLLWSELGTDVEPCRRYGGQGSAWREACRHSGRAANQVRFGREPHNRQGARHHRASNAARPS
jgi:putative ABC transport system substrate-binding protein